MLFSCYFVVVVLQEGLSQWHSELESMDFLKLLDKMVSIRKLQSSLVDECRIYLVPVLGYLSYRQTHSCFTETGVV